MRVSALSDLDPSQVSSVERIYLEAFPAGERMPFGEIVRDVNEGVRIAYVALHEGTALGFASAYVLRSVQMFYLEYLAIDGRYRGGGFGGELWYHICSDARRRRGVTAVVLEVEDPDEPDIDPGTTAARRRRICFYENRGARRLPIAGFRVPLLQGDGEQPMLLMWAPAAQPDPPTGDELTNLVRALYEEGYDLPPDHPLVIATAGK
ncbi:GNAT family N-acetyltransferase [Frankia sp. CcI49]|uniref:GNAT family N-acetyltransferase n=1 Tax=Frankia sp. CcI49 TaxID=1745382 RepID=UPI0009771C8D|nr:GNAT family N-acetyltransferase [Frankia sp. CcI49]ONH56193.1 GNAT family N-acetyltransferase [Frankia sp. CcI49]